MKIVAVETFKFWVEWCNWLFVKVTTDEGIHGWGEGSLHGATTAVESAIQELGATLIGEDPSGVERHWYRMYNAWRWRGGPVLSTALAALDIALWDLEGKRLGVPVHRLLGGALRTELRTYASHWLPGVTSTEAAHAGARDAVSRGFSAFKWNPFDGRLLRENEHRAIGRAADLMAAARDGAGPDVEIFIECSEQLSVRTAILAAEALAPYRPAFLEEPIPFENPEQMVQLQRQIKLPIACGERLLSRWEFLPILTGGGCRIIQPDVMHAKGITEVKRIAALADTFYTPVAPHNPAGPICVAASMHLSAAIPNFYILEQMEDERPFRDEITISPPRLEGGALIVDESPGLGVDLDEERLRHRAFRHQPSSGRKEALYW